MLEAWTMRRVANQNFIKLDFSGLETWLSKKRKVAPSKVISNVSGLNLQLFRHRRALHLSSPKRIRTLMSGEVCIADLEISSLMRDIDGSDQTRSSNEFKFWSNSFDKLKFIYDNLNAKEDENKVKTIGQQKLTQNISSYLMSCVVLTRRLFEVEDDHEQNDIKLNQKVNQLKEQHNTPTARLSDLEK